MLISVDRMPYTINLGKQRENKANKITFDVFGWFKIFGDGVLTAVHKTNSGIEYPIEMLRINVTDYEWIISNVDTNESGYGELQLTYTVDEIVKKSETIQTFVEPSIGVNQTESPEILSSYLDTLNQIGVEVEQNKDATESYKESARQYAEIAKRASEVHKITSVNNKINDVVINADDVGAYTKEETDNKILALNQYVVTEFAEVENKIPLFLSQLRQDTDNQTVTQVEKDKWNNPPEYEEYNDTEIKEAIQDLSEALSDTIGNIPEQLNADGNTIEITNENTIRVPNNIDLMFQSILYGNGESGYRKYRNGLIEQWGVATSSVNGEAVFNMHQPHIDQNFSVFVTPREKGNFFFYAVPNANQKFAVRIQTKDGNSIAVKFQWRSWGRWK